MLESSEVFLAERNTCELLAEFRWLEKETWKGPLIINHIFFPHSQAYVFILKLRESVL